jgi:hypothetical protein
LFDINGVAHLVNEDVEIVDMVFDANGMLDPGETADMVVTIKNWGTVTADDVEATLQTDDSHVTVLNGSASYGSIPARGMADNSAAPFVVEASPSTPSGHYARMNLIVTAAGAEYADSIGFWIRVGLPSGHFLILDVDPNHSSGPILQYTLESLGYSGYYAMEITETRNYLYNFDAVFVCVGIYPDDFMFPSASTDADSLVSYLQNHGGNLVMEGGDLWYYHPLQGGFDFAPYFNINATGDGSADIFTVNGMSGTFTEGMSFLYEGENSWMDHIAPIAPAVKVFNNPSDNQGCGIAYDAGTYKTAGFSFELGGLRDGDDPSTKAAVIDSIMSFFGITAYGTCGDVNGDEEVTPGDGYLILNYFGAGPQPETCWGANVNGDDALTPSDGYVLLNYLGSGDPLNCAPCEFRTPGNLESHVR